MFVFLLLTLASPVPAAGSTEVPPAANAQQTRPIVVTGKPEKQNRIVCSIETPTGSVFARKICRTFEDVDENRAESAKFMDEGSRIQTLQQTRVQPAPTPR